MGNRKTRAQEQDNDIKIYNSKKSAYTLTCIDVLMHNLDTCLL